MKQENLEALSCTARAQAPKGMFVPCARTCPTINCLHAFITRVRPTFVGGKKKVVGRLRKNKHKKEQKKSFFLFLFGGGGAPPGRSFWRCDSLWHKKSRARDKVRPPPEGALFSFVQSNSEGHPMHLSGIMHRRPRSLLALSFRLRRAAVVTCPCTQPTPALPGRTRVASDQKAKPSFYARMTMANDTAKRRDHDQKRMVAATVPGIRTQRFQGDQRAQTAGR